MSEPEVKQSVKAIARRILWIGKVKLDLAKLDTNFTTLEGDMSSMTDTSMTTMTPGGEQVPGVIKW